MNVFTNAFWGVIAKLLSNCPRVLNWLVTMAMRTPYYHLPGYMERYWLIQPRAWLPFAARFHFIKREDIDRTPHDHPWAFRSLILQGWYEEERIANPYGIWPTVTYARHEEGGTNVVGKGEFHRISRVSETGVLTLVILGRKQDSWGFLVAGHRIPWREYLGVSEQTTKAED